jgi:transposase
LPSALAVLKTYPSAQDIVTAGVEPIDQILRAQTPAHFGRPTAKKLVELARSTASLGRALSGRSASLRVLCDQLDHTQANLARLQAEIEHLIAHDPRVKGLQQLPGFGTKTVAVLRAELGDVDRLTRTDQVIAYGGLDIEIKESGRGFGKAKLSKRGSGPARDGCSRLSALRSIHLEGSAFGAYYHRLVGRGRKYGSAVMAVMRKMLAVAVHLLKTGEEYDPHKVSAGASVR